MLVETIGNRGGYTAHDYGETAGDKHVVCAMFSLEPGVLLYCLDAESLLHVPAELFQIIDARLSRFWCFSHEFHRDTAAHRNSFYWGYPEFVSNSDHRADLFEGRRDAVALYEEYKERLALEFALPFIRHEATPLAGGWVMCAVCGDAWKPVDSTDEMVRCPKRGVLQQSRAPTEDRIAWPVVGWATSW